MGRSALNFRTSERAGRFLDLVAEEKEKDEVDIDDVICVGMEVSALELGIHPTLMQSCRRQTVKRNQSSSQIGIHTSKTVLRLPLTMTISYALISFIHFLHICVWVVI